MKPENRKREGAANDLPARELKFYRRRQLHAGTGLARWLIVLGLLAACRPALQAVTLPNDPTTKWVSLPFPTNVVSDYIGDQQTGTAEGDIVGTNGLPATYAVFNPGSSLTNGALGYRVRVGRDASPAGFKAVMHFGMDADLNGSIDVFISVDNTGSSDSIRIFPPGTGANTSPSTTSIDAQNPYFSYPTGSSNYDWSPVNAAIDPAVTNNSIPTPTDIDGGGQTDYFVSFFVPLADVVSALSSNGVSGITSNSAVRYFIATATQANSLNQDVNGLSGSLGINGSFTNIFTPPVTPGGLTNRAPVAVNDVTNTLEEVALTIPPLANDSDPDTNAIFLVSVNTTNGTASVSGTNILFTPATNFVGTVILTYVMTDGITNNNNAVYQIGGTITVNVGPVNDPPAANGQTVPVIEDTPTLVTLTGSDVDGDPLTFVIVASPSNGVITGFNPNTGALTYTPNANFSGPDDFTFLANDGTTNSTVATVSIVVSPVSDVPAADNQNAIVIKNTPKPVTLTGSDGDGDPLSFVLVSGPANGGISGFNTNTGALIYTPGVDYVGPDSFTFRVNDGTSDSAPATISLSVVAANTAPVADAQVVNATEDTPQPVTLTGSDADNNPLTFAIITSPTNGFITGFNPNTGALIYTPGTNYSGGDSLTFHVNDGNTNSPAAVVSINVAPANDAPVASDLSVTMPEDTTTNLVVVGSDAEGAVTYAILSGPANGSLSGFNPGSGAMVYTPATNYTGPDSFTFTVSDGSLLATGTVSVTVAPLNDAPLAADDSYSTLKNVALNISAPGVLGNDADVESDSMSALPVNNPTNGTLSLNANGSFLYTPASNYVGSDVFTYRAYDSGATGNLASVTITITATNTAPVANDDLFTTAEDTTLTIPAAGVLTNDVDADGDLLSAVLVANATQGTLSLNPNGSFTYTPGGNYFGADSFTYRANDGLATSSLATVTVTITPVNDAPIAVNDTTNTVEDVSVTISVLANDSDPEGSPLTITDTSTTNGTALISGTNVVFMPSANFNGAVVFSYTISDGTNSATADVAITVGAVNDAPVANQDAYNTLKNMPLNISAPGVLANDADVENDPLTVSLVADVAHGNLVFNADGSFTYTPGNNYVGPDLFAYQVTDSSSNISGVAEVLITVLTSNSPPVAFSQSLALLANTSTNLVLGGMDPDGDPLSYNVFTLPAHGTLAGLHNTFLYTPDSNYVGSDSFPFSVFDGTTSSSNATVSITILPAADLSVSKMGSTNVAPGTSLIYTISVTNHGPSVATNVVVQDLLPTNLVFVSASGGGAWATNVVTWPAIATLASGAGTNFTVTATAPATGSFTNVALGTSATGDPDPSNNNGTAIGSRVASTVVLPQFGVFKAPNVLNPQTGLYEQRVTVTNTGTATAAALQVLVGDLNGTNGVPRTNVTLVNATGTNVDSRPYLQYNSPLNPGNRVTLVLEFFVPDRKPFTNSIEIIAVLPSSAGTNATAGVVIDRVFADTRLTPPRFVLEWTSVPRKTYTVIYSDNGPTGPWLVATPTVTASANRVQWYDDGPPKTVSSPASVSSRLYRVIANP